MIVGLLEKSSVVKAVALGREVCTKQDLSGNDHVPPSVRLQRPLKTFTRAMSATTVLKSCLMTCYYAEKSTSNYIYASLGTTLGDLRVQIHAKVKSTLEVNWGERDTIHPNSASIMISARKKGDFSLKTHEEATEFHTWQA